MARIDGGYTALNIGNSLIAGSALLGITELVMERVLMFLIPHFVLFYD